MPNDRIILHCDLNGFFASVEELSHPETRGKPVAVGGDPQSRKGIILAKNELAKKRGVLTGQTIWQAKKKCPGLIVLPPRHDAYARYSRMANEIYYRFTDKVEPFGIDESWLDITASARLFGTGAQIADKIRQTVKRELGLTVSVGVSFNKVFAKLGSDFKKPDATTVFDRGAIETIHALPVKDMLFVGAQTAQTLARMGIHTIGELARAPEALVARRLGKAGAMLRKYARGEDDSPVGFYGETAEAKSVGNSQTFRRDISGEDDFRAGFGIVAETLAMRMAAAKLKCREISITVKSADFKTTTRQTTLESPTNSYRKIVGVCMALARRARIVDKPARMLGISASKLSDAGKACAQPDLFDAASSADDGRAEEIMFKIKEKFGQSAVFFADMLGTDL